MAQVPRTITITDEKGVAIALAEVGVKASGTDVELISDDNGHVVLDPALWQGAHPIHLTISAVGYVGIEADLDERGGIDHVFRLRPTDAEGGDIVIVARRISRPFSPKVLGFQDIVTDAKAQADPILAVNDLPASTNVTGNARLTLRGSRAAINRAYLNDTPVYEFTTGSELDDSTQARSVFGLTVASEVETYPGNPPAYLAGATGGVVRLTSPDNKTNSGVFSINDFGLGAGRTFASSNGADFVSLYGSLTDLSLHRAINPTLDSVFKTIRSVSGGGVARKTFANGGDVRFFVQGEIGDDVFPFTVYGTQSLFRLKPAKGRAVVNISSPWAGFVVNANVAYTISNVREAFGNWRADNTNQYAFASLDLARTFFHDRLIARIGVDGEDIDQTSTTNSGAAGSIYSPTQPSQALNNRLRQATAYVFATFNLGKTVALSVGSRRTIAGNLKPGYSVQFSGTLVSSDRKHKLIVSAGRYGGAAVPTRAYYGSISRSVSDQLEVDYSYKRNNAKIGLTGYLSRERSDGLFYDPGIFGNANITDNITGIARLTRSRGLEAYAELALFKALEAQLSFTTVRQTVMLGGQRLRGANDYPSIVRASLRYVAPPSTSLSLSLTRRSGEPYTQATGSTIVNGMPTPTYGTINGTRLAPYLSIDASFSRPIDIGGKFGKPLFFMTATNILDHRNPSSQILTMPNVQTQYRYLAGRTVSFGLIWTY
ncbi:hypothetical protein BH10PSE14_BH10PSE14_04100 [soil metagenome]